MGRKYDPKGTNSLFECFIVSFDLHNEVFNYIELPDCEYKCRKDIVPAVIDEKLAILDKYADNVWIVWVMDEYGVPRSWAKLYKFEFAIDRFLYLKDAEMLFAEGEGVKLYNMESKVTKDLSRLSYESWKYKVYAYTESLMLFNLVDGGSA